MDGLGFYIPFNSILAISGRWKGEHEKAVCSEAPIRLGKNLASSGIRTRDPVDRSREHVLKIGLKLSIFGHGVAIHVYSLYNKALFVCGARISPQARLDFMALISCLKPGNANRP